MADDRDFKIKITGDASSLVAATKQSNEALNQTGLAGKESAKGLEETAKSAGLATVKHKDLRSAVLGLRDSFPELGRIAHMALHPITLAVATVGAAWWLLKSRVEEATRAMAGVQLPDISPREVGKVTALAEAWRSYAEAVKHTADAYNSVEARANRVLKQLALEAEQQKQLLAARKGLELADLERDKATISGSDYERRKLGIEDRYAAAGLAASQRHKESEIYAHLDEARDLRLDAAKKLRASAAIKVGTADDDVETQAELKKRRDEAEKSIAERRERIGGIREVGASEGGFFKNILAGFAMQRRYGLLARSPAGMEAAVQMEKDSIAIEQVNIDRYNAFMRNRAARSEARKRMTDLAGEAGADFGRARVLEAETGAEMESAAGEFGVNRRVAGMESLARAKLAVGRANDRLKQFAEEIIKDVEAQHGITAEQIDRMRDLNNTVSDLNKRVRDIEGRPPRTY